THVVVDRGLVAVLASGAQSWVRAGEQWPPALEPAAVEPRAAEPAVEAKPAEIAPAPAERGGGPTVRRSVHEAARRSAPAQRFLAAENRVFAAAMAKHKAGDLSGALQKIDRLIEQYPDSLLMQ